MKANSQVDNKMSLYNILACPEDHMHLANELFLFTALACAFRIYASRERHDSDSFGN